MQDVMRYKRREMQNGANFFSPHVCLSISGEHHDAHHVQDAGIVETTLQMPYI